MAKFLPSILTSISKKPPSATSNIKLIFVPCFTLSKKHSSAWASTCKIAMVFWDILMVLNYVLRETDLVIDLN